MSDESPRDRVFGGILVCGLFVTFGAPLAWCFGYFTLTTALLFSVAVVVVYLLLLLLFSWDTPDVPVDPTEAKEFREYQANQAEKKQKKQKKKGDTHN